MALALGKLTTGTPKFRGSGFVGMHVKPITAQEKFNFPRANAILARAQALLWVRDCISPGRVVSWAHRMSGYFPYNSGHVNEIIFWGYHIQVV
jgi:hypothetical protein